MEHLKSKELSLIVLVVFVVLVIFFFNPLVNHTVESEVINTAKQRYEMCLRNYDYTGASGEATLISVTFQQMGNEEGYRKWHEIANTMTEKVIAIDMNKIRYYNNY